MRPSAKKSAHYPARKTERYKLHLRDAASGVLCSARGATRPKSAVATCHTRAAPPRACPHEDRQQGRAAPDRRGLHALQRHDAGPFEGLRFHDPRHSCCLTLGKATRFCLWPRPAPAHGAGLPGHGRGCAASPSPFGPGTARTTTAHGAEAEEQKSCRRREAGGCLVGREGSLASEEAAPPWRRSWAGKARRLRLVSHGNAPPGPPGRPTAPPAHAPSTAPPGPVAGAVLGTN